MCGIAGYFGQKELNEDLLQSTLNLMKRRGPNAQHVHKIPLISSKNCYLLHARLSIIDLDSRSNQPLTYNGKTIIFNGEIYNYLEIKKKLLALGHQFVTASDTEVLLHALDEWGETAFDQIEGMWAFALFDERNKKLMLSRDPFGEKPLYYYRSEYNDIYFGSEIKLLSSLSQLKFYPNLEKISRFLVNGYRSLYKKNDTFFERVMEVEPGSFVLIDLDGRFTKSRYWNPRFYENSDLSFKEAVSITRDKLIRSLELRLRSDLPVAFHLSGGIDSSSLISIAKKIFDYPVHGFTVRNTDIRYEEQQLVQMNVEALGIEYTEVDITKENFLKNLKELVCYHDAPVLTITSYLHWLLQRKVNDLGYHISVSGTAADELFAGYFDHQLMYFYDIQDQASIFDAAIAGWQREIAPVVRNPKLKSYDSFIHNPFERGHAYLHNDVYSSYLFHGWKEPFEEKYYRSGLLRNRMLNELFHETTPVILHEDDLNSMYFSIENRSPFLDRDLFNFISTIPTQYLIQNGKSKAVLREAMRNIVIDPVLESGRKVGFNAPISDLIDFKDASTRDDILADSPIFELIKKESIRALLEKDILPNSDSKFLFSFISSKYFLESFN